MDINSSLIHIRVLDDCVIRIENQRWGRRKYLGFRGFKALCQIRVLPVAELSGCFQFNLPHLENLLIPVLPPHFKSLLGAAKPIPFVNFVRCCSHRVQRHHKHGSQSCPTFQVSAFSGSTRSGCNNLL